MFCCGKNKLFSLIINLLILLINFMVTAFEKVLYFPVLNASWQNVCSSCYFQLYCVFRPLILLYHSKEFWISFKRKFFFLHVGKRLNPWIIVGARYLPDIPRDWNRKDSHLETKHYTLGVPFTLIVQLRSYWQTMDNCGKKC